MVEGRRYIMARPQEMQTKMKLRSSVSACAAMRILPQGVHFELFMIDVANR